MFNKSALKLANARIQQLLDQVESAELTAAVAEHMLQTVQADNAYLEQRLDEVSRRMYHLEDVAYYAEFGLGIDLLQLEAEAEAWFMGTVARAGAEVEVLTDEEFDVDAYLNAVIDADFDAEVFGDSDDQLQARW